MGCFCSKPGKPKPEINGPKPETSNRTQFQTQQQYNHHQQTRRRRHRHTPTTQVQVIVQPQKLPLPQPNQETSIPQNPNQQPEPILSKPFEDIKEKFTLGKKLGRGEFGITYLCTENSTGKTFACKSILKRRLKRVQDRENVGREIQIMQHLSRQPNIVEIKDVYEDRQSVHLVMELCEGGDLFDRIMKKGQYSEKAAAEIIRCVVNAVKICHFMGVMHRDLKPENFLLSGKDEASVMLKATDFGVSVFIEEGKVYRDIVGSAYYVAPEVLRRSYGKEIDIWSAGVILYILLSGVPPFWAETEKGIFKEILKGEIDFESEPWPLISESAKDLVIKMLTQDPQKRLTATQVLEHPWIREGGEASDEPIDCAVLSRMKKLRAMNEHRKLASEVIAQNLSEEEIRGLKTVFANMDTEKNGTITLDELKTGLDRLGSKLSEAKVKQLLEAADVDERGKIDYVDFLSTTMHQCNSRYHMGDEPDAAMLECRR